MTNIEPAVRRLLDLGSETLGPPVLRGPDGVPFTILRDPLGAVFAVREGARTPKRSPRCLASASRRTDVERAWAIYAELFGWSHTATAEMNGLEGGHRMFAWEDDGDTVGGMANTARWPGVHTHWLFCFTIDDLDDAIAKVRANAGTAQSPIILPNGDRIAPCEDPQGAAFGLLQPMARNVQSD